ncbi:MAG: glycosyltransferase family 4 protein [Acidobacteria bacterium]|nr:glycosyltransferase family 4 protein [Acidobacteriota bacterium]
MRIACLIESLGSGGAERQMSELAAGLREKGHPVALCYYHGQESVSDFYETRLKRSGVTVERLGVTGKLGRIRGARSWLNRVKPDVVQAYLPGSNAIAVLSGLGGRQWKVVVSERIDPDYGRRGNLRAKAITRLYRGADWIVANSHSILEALVTYMPAYRKKASVIWNCVDLDRFRPRENPKEPARFRFVCVASMNTRKNSRRLAEALALLKHRSPQPFDLRWVGRYNDQIPDQRNNMAETREIIERSGLGGEFTFAGEIENVESEYRQADAAVLVSTREGLPNTVCEGMASGLPIVAGAVADIPRIVQDGENGFLCDPWNVSDIARALERCLALSPEERARFGKASRRFAEEQFGRSGFIRNYESLYRSLFDGRSDSSMGRTSLTGGFTT